MIQHPGVLALLLASGLVSLLLVAAGWQGLRILRGWNLQSGSETKLDLERRTYLVSALVAKALVIQILSLFRFIFTADKLHTQFVGAMCSWLTGREPLPAARIVGTALIQFDSPLGCRNGRLPASDSVTSNPSLSAPR